MTKCSLATAVILMAAALLPDLSPAPIGKSIDVPRSSIHIHVFKSGLFSPFAHNHDIEAPVASGEVTEEGEPSVDIRVDARTLRVVDPQDASDTRNAVQARMLGPQVLDSERYPDIHFHSTRIEPDGAGHWNVTGDLALHGQTHPISVTVERKGGFYTGSAALQQTTFGIAPVTVAGGTVKVKDVLRVEFQIAVGD